MTASFFHRPTPVNEEILKMNHDRRVNNARQIYRNMPIYLRMRGKRLFVCGLAILVAWYLFTHRLLDYVHRDTPVTQYDNTGSDHDYAGPEAADQFKVVSEKDAPPARPSAAPALPLAVTEPAQLSNGKFATKHYYEGEINFDELPSTMRSMSRLGGWQRQNKHVLFSAASLQAAAHIIPLACDMAQHGHNEVHMALMGRQDLSIRDILLVNNVDADCEVVFHDARPDFAQYSTDGRAESSVVSALAYMYQRMHPQVVITSSTTLEDDFFTRATKNTLSEFGIPLIQIPDVQPRSDGRASDNLAWIGRLDSAALSAWNKPNIEIIITVQPQSVGKVDRLLDSLQKADYSGSMAPRLVIDLPSEASDMLVQKLGTFQWPPGKHAADRSELSIRRRIPIRSATAEEASVQFMESFFPADVHNSHVLILSSDSIVSPLFHQALRYHLLQLKYSRTAPEYPPLMGIALDLPRRSFNGSKFFSTPKISAVDITSRREISPASPNARPHFLLPAPNKDAALYFGAAWKELHSFVSYRLIESSLQQSTVAGHVGREIDASAWTDFAFEFMQMRGLSLFYPGSIAPQEAFVFRPAADHNARESDHPSSANIDPESSPSTIRDTLSAASESTSVSKLAILSHAPPRTDTSQIFRQILLTLLPYRHDEPPPSTLPQLSWDGVLSSADTIARRAFFEAERFRRTTGGCAKVEIPKGKRRRIDSGSARDLFCFGDHSETWIDDERSAPVKTFTHKS